MEENTLPKYAIVIDVDFINKYLPELKRHINTFIKREVQDLDLAYFCAQLGSMMNVDEDKDERFFVILVSTDGDAKLANCIPGSVAEVNNRGCHLGNWDFEFTNFTSAGMVNVSDRILEMIDVLAQKQEVERVFLIPEESQIAPPHVHSFIELLKKHMGADAFLRKSFFLGGLQKADRFSHLQGLPYMNLTFAFCVAFGLTDKEIESIHIKSN